MPYPFAPMPTRDDLCAKLAPYGVTAREMAVATDGGLATVLVLERASGFSTKVHSIVYAEKGETLTPSVVRSVCARLGIDPAIFGLHLG